MRKNIAVIGKHGALAQGILNSNIAGRHKITSYGKSDYNLSIKNDAICLAKQIADHDVIIVCTGVMSNDVWDTYLINVIGIGCLIKSLIELKSTARVIIAGSHSSMWNAWPGMSEERLWYNNSKRALYDLITSISHSEISNLELTLINFSRFESKMNNYTGYAVETVVDYVTNAIDAKVPALIVEMAAPK